MEGFRGWNARIPSSLEGILGLGCILLIVAVAVVHRPGGFVLLSGLSVPSASLSEEVALKLDDGEKVTASPYDLGVWCIRGSRKGNMTVRFVSPILPLASWSLPVDSDGTVTMLSNRRLLVRGGDGKSLYVLDPRSPQKIIHWVPPDGSRITCVGSAPDGTTVTSTCGGGRKAESVWVLDRESGLVRRVEFERGAFMLPVVDADIHCRLVAVGIATLGSEVRYGFAIIGENGSVLYVKDILKDPPIHIEFGSDGKRLLVLAGRTLDVYDVLDGKQKFRRDLGEEIYMGFRISGDNILVITGRYSSDGDERRKTDVRNVLCYDWEGNRLWARSFPRDVRIVGLSEGDQFIVSSTRGVEAFRRDGHQLWRVRPNQLRGSAILTCAGYVFTRDGMEACILKVSTEGGR